MSNFYFYDIPVYRLPEETYYSDRKAFIEENLFKPNTPESDFRIDFYKKYPDRAAIFRYHLEKRYGGSWRFNEIIGYIRLYFFGSQIRGEYYTVDSKRIVRTRKKQIEWRTWKLAPEIDIEPPYGNSEILVAIREYIEDCKKEIPKRFIDTSTFDIINQFIDWKALLKHSR